MNKYEFICQYCNAKWQVNYAPKEKVYCSVCKDTNIRIRDLHAEAVDYYVDCPPFEEPNKHGYDNWTF